MALNDPVPSNAPDVLLRNMEDIDTFANGNELDVVNRVGNNIRTIAGIERDAQLAIASGGYIPVTGSFESGGTITARNEVLLYEADGYYYRWAGDLSVPKVVVAASTPATAGGVGAGAWTAVGGIDTGFFRTATVAITGGLDVLDLRYDNFDSATGTLQPQELWINTRQFFKATIDGVNAGYTVTGDYQITLDTTSSGGEVVSVSQNADDVKVNDTYGLTITRRVVIGAGLDQLDTRYDNLDSSTGSLLDEEFWVFTGQFFKMLIDTVDSGYNVVDDYLIDLDATSSGGEVIELFQNALDKRVKVPYIYAGDRGIIYNDRTAATSNATILDILRDEAYSRGVPLLLGSGTIFTDSRWDLDKRVTVIGDGTNDWDWTPAFLGGEFTECPTQIVVIGTGTRDLTLYGASSMQASGAKWANPSATPASYNDSEYKMLSFVEDSTTDARSLKGFSAGIHIYGKLAEGTVLKGFRVLPDYGGDDGLEGYNDSVADGTKAWAADWDVGIYQDGTSDVTIEDVQAVGHWRMAGRAISAVGNGGPTKYDTTGWSNPYKTTDKDFVYEGARALAIRGTDAFQIVAITTTYVEVPWADDHPFQFGITGYNNVQLAKHFLTSTQFAFTSATKVNVSGEDRVRIALSSDPIAAGYAAGDTVHPRTIGGGTSQITFERGRLGSMTHPSGYVAHSLQLSDPLDNPGEDLEISGWKAVEITLKSVAFESQNEVAFHLHAIDQLRMSDCSWERHDNREQSGLNVKRAIAAPWHSTNPNVSAGRAAGVTSLLSITGSNLLPSFSLDIRPYHPQRNVGTFTDGADNGMFRGMDTYLPEWSMISNPRFLNAMRAPIGGITGLCDSTYSYTPTDGGGRLYGLKFWYDDTDDAVYTNADLLPNDDNMYALGGASNRYTEVFAATGTINTSDANEKQQIRDLTAAEKNVATALKGMIKAFKFNDAVEQKGDGARIHVGVIAQDVKAAFEAEGLVAEEYGILCYDEWDEKLDRDGNIINDAGNRYGVRYEELLAFIISAM